MAREGILKKNLPFAAAASLLLLLFSNYVFFSIADSENMLNLAVSIYELGDLSIAVKINVLTGEQVPDYSKYGLGLPFLMVPFLFAADLIHAICPPLETNLVISLVNVLVISALAQVVFLIVREAGYGYGRAFIISLVSVFGAFVYPYAYYFFSEPLQALCLAAAFLFLFRASKRGSGWAHNLAIGGLFLGYAVFTKVTLLFTLPFYGGYVLLTSLKKGRAALRVTAFTAALGAMGALMAYLNYRRFGSVLEFGYGKEAGLFINPIASGVYDFLLNPDKSLLLFAPFTLLLPIAAWAFTRRHRAEGVLIAALTLTNLLVYSAWWAWEGGECWGPRFLLPFVPLTAVMLATLMDKRIFKAAVLALFAAGFAVNSLGALQDLTAYHYIVLKSVSPGLLTELKASGDPVLVSTRLKRDYVALESSPEPQLPPHVVSTELPEFNALSGHLWLLRAKAEGLVEGYGLGPENRGYRNPPWVKKHPESPPPPEASLPLELQARIECPMPLLLKGLCGATPSMPYYFDALMNQADKAEALGRVEDAKRLREKAGRERAQKWKRTLQMRVKG